MRLSVSRTSLAAGARVFLALGWCSLPALAQTVSESPRLPKLATAVAFPNLKFERPLALAYPEDESNLLFVAGQRGIIYSFPNAKTTSDATVFLDISKRVYSPDVGGHNEEGLLGLAFHPRYRENGQFFVYYSA